MPKIYILILVWNDWQNTIECLESVFKLDYEKFEVVIVDNGSTDGSLTKIKAWSEGRLEAKTETNDPAITSLVYPPVKKPLKLTLLQSGSNLGYAAGNNYGLRYALAQGDFDYAFIINNDVVLKKDCLTELVKRVGQDSKIGLAGPVQLRYSQPDIVAGLGATYDRWFAQAFHLGGGKPFDFAQPEKYLKFEPKINYIIGAAVFVSKSFLLDVGLMSKDYFLFFEEIDWAVRARRKGYKLALAPRSIIYHKEGASISKLESKKKRRFTLNFDKYNTRNRLLFSWKFYPYVLPILYLSILGYIIDRLSIGAFSNAWVIAQELIRHLTWPVRLVWRNRPVLKA